MLRNVLRLIMQGVEDLWLNPWAQALTLAAVSLVVFLAGSFLLMIHNLNAELLYARGEVLFQVYWDADTELSQVQSQWKQLTAMEYLTDVHTFTPEQGLEELTRSMSEAVDFDWMDPEDNPLPPTALLAFAPQEGDNELWTRKTLHYLQNLPNVSNVHVSPLRSDLTQSWAKISQRVLWPLILFLGVVLALVVGNTLKLSQYSRKEEIEILHLVGAKQWFINLPLVTGGFVQGALGGLIGLAMLKAVQLTLYDVFAFPPLMFTVSFLPLAQAAMLAIAPALVGAASGWVAVGK